MRFSTLLLSAVIALGSLTAVEAKTVTRPYGQSTRKSKNKKAKKFKPGKYKAGKYKAPKQKSKWGAKRKH